MICVISCVLWHHVQFESNFVASLVSFVAVLSPVTCLHLSWWDFTVIQIITPCDATKLIVCYLLQMLLLSLLTLWLLKTFLLHSSTATSLYMYLAFSLLRRASDISAVMERRNSGKSAKFLRNRPVFPQICPKKSCDLWLFLPRPVRSPVYGRTFLQSNWENCEHQKHFWNVIVL